MLWSLLKPNMKTPIKGPWGFIFPSVKSPAREVRACYCAEVCMHQRHTNTRPRSASPVGSKKEVDYKSAWKDITVMAIQCFYFMHSWECQSTLYAGVPCHQDARIGSISLQPLERMWPKKQQKLQYTADHLGQLRGRQNLTFPMKIWLNNWC